MAWGAANPVDITLQTSARANVNAAKQASPLPVILFVLRDAKDFNKASYFALEDNARRSLGTDLLLEKSKILLPGKRSHLQFKANDDARYIGIVAGYSKLKGKRWRKVVAISDLNKANLQVNFTAKGLSTLITTRAAQAKSSWYTEGGLAFGMPTVTSDNFSYTAGKVSTLTNNKIKSFGQLNVGGGYQWLRNKDNWLDTLHLEKFSVGVSFAFNPVNNVNGEVLDVDNAIPRAYKLDVSSQAYTLDSKINFMRFSSFTTFLNAGVGMVRYASKYKRDSSSGVELLTNNSNFSPMVKAGIGLEYDYDEELSIILGYEYHSPTKIEVKETISGVKPALTSPTLTLNNSQVFVKFRYLFKG
jgi:type VI secretion system VasD/TssJ family lipoprotein